MEFGTNVSYQTHARMRLGFAIICVFILGCTSKEQKSYVQTQEISLAQPRITATNKLIDSSVVVTADLGMEGVQLFYTDDGAEPTKQSLLYKEPLIIEKEGTLKFKAFHTDWKSSEEASLTLFKKGIVPKHINWTTKAHENYPDETHLGLINQKKGSLNFRDIEWTGFDSIAKATIHFTKKVYVKSLTIGYLIDTKSWIFPPEEVVLYLNEKDLINNKAIPYLTSDVKAVESSRFPIAQELESITIVIKNLEKLPDWHPGKGNKAWLFLDEFIFNE